MTYRMIKNGVSEAVSLRYPCVVTYAGQGPDHARRLVVICTHAASRQMPKVVDGPKELREMYGVHEVRRCSAKAARAREAA